jgi:hypothetical protein
MLFVEYWLRKKEMEQDFERYDLNTLMKLYLDESREFSKALASGSGWRQLHMLRDRIRRINELINKRTIEEAGSFRVRNQPPHGDH